MSTEYTGGGFGTVPSNDPGEREGIAPQKSGNPPVGRAKPYSEKTYDNTATSTKPAADNSETSFYAARHVDPQHSDHPVPPAGE